MEYSPDGYFAGKLSVGYGNQGAGQRRLRCELEQGEFAQLQSFGGGGDEGPTVPFLEPSLSAGISVILSGAGN